MTTRLKKVITRINKLGAKEQDALAELISDELSRDKSFHDSQSELSMLAAEATTEYKRSKTRSLNLNEIG